MRDALLILNSGSSSLKFTVYVNGDPPRALLDGQFQSMTTHPRFRADDGNGAAVGERDWGEGQSLGHLGAIEHLVTWGRSGVLAPHQIAAVGHRVVHGGVQFTGPVRVDSEVVAALEKLVPLAPLHQPHSLTAIKATTEIAPQLPQVACFDTAFHRTQPDVAQAFALPRRLSNEGVHRYGFHGLSYEYIASVLPEVDARLAAGKTVVAHLGNGVSMCAMQACRSVATTMGFTALDGVPMGTRCGAIDPGVLIYLVDQHGMGARDLEKLLYQESGLLGVSGVSSDMRSLLASELPSSREAVELFVYRIARELGSLAAALGGLDGIVFTGGIGENSAEIRARVCRDASWLGVELDEGANADGGPRISTTGSSTAVYAIPTDEELMIARHTHDLLATELASDNI